MKLKLTLLLFCLLCIGLFSEAQDNKKVPPPPPKPAIKAAKFKPPKIVKDVDAPTPPPPPPAKARVKFSPPRIVKDPPPPPPPAKPTKVKKAIPEKNNVPPPPPPSDLSNFSSPEPAPNIRKWYHSPVPLNQDTPPLSDERA